MSELAMAASLRSLASKIVLNDGVAMPIFGLGTGPGNMKPAIYMEGNAGKTLEMVKIALQKGYTMIDTAEFYL